ncbi:MAG: hypothetical protein ACYTJ0_04945 [Planctomycetota bacterium]|jgi:hypothetical protein
MKTSLISLLLSVGLVLWVAGCTDAPGDAGSSPGTHTHEDGSTHEDHGDEPAEDAGHADDHAGDEDHAHDEVPLGTATIGEWQVELAQGHGAVVAGEESHLVVKLPYTDDGATVVRAWIGTDDRTLSFVGKGEYAPSHDDYDIHAMAPDPLPEDAMWWIEIEKPDGTKVVGSAKPIME